MTLEEATEKLRVLVNELDEAGFAIYGYEGESSGIVVKDRESRRSDVIENRW